MSEAIRISWKQQLHNDWLRAQGVPDWTIFERRWKNPFLFEVYPPHCVVCDRPWRPDFPKYIALYGKTRRGKEGFSEWYSPALGITADTGLAPDQMQVRDLCTEHSDRWSWVPDCQTGEKVGLAPPLSSGQRAWRDARYWTGCALRFVWLLGQWAWLWTAYKAVGHRATFVRAPWPPLRKAR